MKKVFLIVGLSFGLFCLTAGAQMTPSPNDSNQQQPSASTPGTPPTFPTDRQDTDAQQQNRNEKDRTSKDPDADKPQPDKDPGSVQKQDPNSDRDISRPQDDQTPQATPNDQPPKSDRDYDRDRNTGSIGSNAGEQKPPDHDGDQGDQAQKADRDHRSDYQSQLQNALQQNPNLSGLQASYTDTTVELTGTVPTGKERHQARMIAQEYANGRRVVDHIAVTGKGR